MPEIPSKATFESLYAGNAPWDIRRPQKPFVDSADRIKGAILDAGCGTGDMALYFAGRGNKVTGIDYLEEPISRARAKSAGNANVTFLVKDATTLKNWNERFENIVDSGLFHCFSDDDRATYVGGLATVLRPDGRLFLLCFSDAEPGEQGPRRITKQELTDAFAHGWTIESITATHFEIRPDFHEMAFSPGGPRAWFAVIRREG